MPLTNAGRNMIGALLVGQATTAFTSTAAHIAVGNSSTAFASADTDMQGSETARKAMDTGFPTRTLNSLVFRATFSAGEANLSGGWEEWGVTNSAVGGTLLNRAVSALGEKTAAQTWQVTCSVLVQNP